MQVRRGGNCPNSVEVLAQLLSRGPCRLPIALHLVSCLPDARAAATRTILSSFGGGGSGSDTTVDCSYCLYREGHEEPASSYIIRSAETGSRTIVNFNDLPEMTVSEFEKIADALTAQGGECWWHFEVRVHKAGRWVSRCLSLGCKSMSPLTLSQGRIPETTLRCMRYLRQVMPGCTISVEVEKPNREGLAGLAAEADVVFYSRSWAEVSLVCPGCNADGLGCVGAS